MLAEKLVFEAIGFAIQDESFGIESTKENTENWDSLGDLSIVTTLARLTGGKSDAIPEIAMTSTAKDLARILRENGLLE